jgi:hypothetical protein
MTSQRARSVLIATLIVAVALPLGANATGNRSSGSLQINATLGTGYQISPQLCTPETPPTTTRCVRFVGSVGIPGLGRATVTYVKSFDETICPGQVTGAKNAAIDVAGKGQINVAMVYPACADPAPNSVVLGGTIIGGTGRFAGVSGSLQLSNSVNAPSCGPGGCTGTGTDTWTGNLAVPGLAFDLTLPTLQPVGPKTVKAPKRAKTVRVRYSLRATDEIDGPVPVNCSPRSGSLFKVGRRTRVLCSAEDTSANVATTSFIVTVKRSRR